VAAWYLTRPVPRTFIAIAPIANSTGDATLDPYRLGLTLALSRELSESSDVRGRPVCADAGTDSALSNRQSGLSGPERCRALEGASGAGVVVAPVLLYDRGAWRRTRRFATATTHRSAGSRPIRSKSSLTKEACRQRWSDRWRGRSRPAFTSAGGHSGRHAASGTLASLEAARAFEAGVNAYDTGEFAAARDAFARAAREDPRHPLPAAGRRASRSRWATGTWPRRRPIAPRRDCPSASPAEALLVQGRRGRSAPSGRKRQPLVRGAGRGASRRSVGAGRAGGYQDRSGRTADAIASYRRLLDAAGRQPGPALELCRLYNPAR
jgi:hypothetical protein